jgi:outer membrane protein W
MQKGPVILAAAAFVLLGAQLGIAQTEPGDLGIGIKASYYGIQDDSMSLNPPGANFDTEYDEALLFEVSLTYVVTLQFSLEFSAGYTVTDMYADPGGTFIRYGELTQYFGMVTARYHFGSGEALRFHVGAGAGYVFNDMDQADDPGEFFSGAPPDVKAVAEDAIAFQILIGFEYLISDGITFGVDARYFIHSADQGWDSIAYDTRDETGMDAIIGTVGIRFY